MLREFLGRFIGGAALFLLLSESLFAAAPDAPALAVARATSYLGREIANWPGENGCRSCHNQGDAARVFFDVAADQAVQEVDLKSTRDWLYAPANWNQNQGDPRFNDQQLSVIQFSSALASMVNREPTREGKAALHSAAGLLVGYQQEDGAWHVKTGGVVGSPVIYGTPLATAQSVNVLRQSNGPEFAESIARAEAYLIDSQIGTTPGAAAVLIGLPRDDNDTHMARRQACQSRLLAGQHRSGGWGPYVGYAPENFDTAIAIIGLQSCVPSAEVTAAIERGREYLRAKQRDDGSWDETTRPDPQESYAHRVSTSAWVTRSLAK